MNERYENINLLRAFAASAVVVYHVIELMQWKAFPGEGPLLTFRVGWIGVDLFFVISGFVITRSAQALWRRDAATFARNYWARRVSRIVPLYVLTGALWIVFFWPDIFSNPAWKVAGQFVSHLTFTHSFLPQTFDSIDGVNWTLALEMQFYLAIALLIPWISRVPGWCIWLGCILIAWTWRAIMFHYFGHMETHRLFISVMQLPGTVDEFGAGIFLACWMDRHPGPRLKDGAIWLLAAIAVGTLCMGIYWTHASYWDQQGMVIFWRTLLGVFFLCVVATAVYLPSFAQIWPMRPLWYLGTVSYGIYLWHLFAIKICLMNPGLSPLQALGITLGLAVLLAATSWHFFEKPLLEYGRRFHGETVPRRGPASAGKP